MTDDTADFATRLTGLGVPADKVAAAIVHLESRAVSRHFHGFASDEELGKKLSDFAKAEEPQADLNAPGPKNPEFTKFLGGLASIFDQMQPQRRMALWFEFKASKPPSERSVLSEELRVRYGENAPIDRLSTADKLAVAHEVGTRKTEPPAKIAITKEVRVMSPAMKLEYLHARAELVKIRNSTREFDQTRVKAILARFGQGILAA